MTMTFNCYWREPTPEQSVGRDERSGVGDALVRDIGRRAVHRLRHRGLTSGMRRRRTPINIGILLGFPGVLGKNIVGFATITGPASSRPARRQIALA
jgi:hypothetical protein